MKEIVEKWEKIGLLSGTKTNYQKEQLALILENQRLFNASSENVFIHKVSLPIIIRVFNDFIGFDLVSVQTIVTGKEVKFKDKLGRIQTTETKIGASKLKTKCYEYDDGRIHGNNGLQQYVKEVAEQVVAELNREVIIDLQQVATTIKHHWKTPQNLADSILMASSQLDKRIGLSANWIVTSVDLVEELKKLGSDFVSVENNGDSNLAVKKVGKLNKRWDVYADPLMESNCVLLGFRGDELTSGYIFSPFIMFNLSGSNLIAYYGKKLMDPGYFIKINVDNYSVEPEEYYPIFVEQFEPDFPGVEQFEDNEEEIEVENEQLLVG